MGFKTGIDDGHGINTAGKRTVELKEDIVFNGKVRKKGTIIHENEFNKAIMYLVEPHLKRCGIGYVELAPTDADTPLGVRASTANNAGCDIVVSIHANALTGDKWQNKAYGLVVIKTYNCQSKSNKLADIMYKHLKEVDFPSNGETKYGVRVDKDICGFTLAILRQTHMPSVLVELGFMDNWEDVQVMCSPKFQNECAKGIAMAICEYAGIKFVEPVPPKPQVQDDYINCKDFVVAIKVTDLNIRSGAGSSFKKVGEVHKGQAFTIVGTNKSGTWGKLKSGAGWICITKKYVEKK